MYSTTFDDDMAMAAGPGGCPLLMDSLLLGLLLLSLLLLGLLLLRVTRGTASIAIGTFNCANCSKKKRFAFSAGRESFSWF
jgi:hypothetical protein